MKPACKNCLNSNDCTHMSQAIGCKEFTPVWATRKREDTHRPVIRSSFVKNDMANPMYNIEEFFKDLAQV